MSLSTELLEKPSLKIDQNRWTEMRKFFLVLLLTLSFAGFAEAQETTGAKAEEAKKEVLKIELDKVTNLNKNGSDAAAWFDSNNANSVSMMLGGSFRNKAQQLASFHSGELFLLSQRQYDHHIYVYNNGTVAVVTIRVEAVFKGVDGKPSTVNNLFTNVWVKYPDGRWQRIVHDSERERPWNPTGSPNDGGSAPQH